MTAVILAAGMGNRYGGLKQIDPLGPSGEFIIDYSVFDAIRAGYDTVVFIIKKEMYETFRDTIGKRLEGRIRVRYAFQDPDDLPEGLSFPEGRIKPLGTTHALYCCRREVEGPFAIFNADDFYGYGTFLAVKRFLDQAGEGEFCMPGYIVNHTLSENGSVSRGICQTENGLLTGIVERKQILPEGENAKYEENGKWISIEGNTPVSMNFWGFTPKIFDFAERRLRAFLTDPASDLIKEESYLTELAEDVVRAPGYSIRVVKTDCVWKGVTYQEDRPAFRAYLEACIRAGEYPSRLWTASAGIS
ncbi:MAG: nucleotidyltransferase [Oscillospiraceae bacterium]|nr:nucleotidyltransferase [Oscillospiraceae bacterium]